MKGIKDVMTAFPRSLPPGLLAMASCPNSEVRGALASSAAPSASLDSPALTIRTHGVAMDLPDLIANAGHKAAEQTFEFFTARIPNENTRAAYERAFWRFSSWCRQGGLPLKGITPPAIAAYLKALESDGLSAASIKQHLAALRHWLGWLTEHGVLPLNPAASVRGPRLVVREGKTPVLERDQASALLDSMGGNDILCLRDKALISLMLFNFVRVGAAVKMVVRDFEDAGDASAIVLHEKGGKDSRKPAHHRVCEALRAFISAARFEPRSKAPLFQSTSGRSRPLSGSPMSRSDVLAMVKRRCAAIGLPPSICNHSFRATGITIHQENGGRLEDAQQLAGHADMRTTQLYNRKSRNVERREVERVQL